MSVSDSTFAPFNVPQENFDVCISHLSNSDFNPVLKLDPVSQRALAVIEELSEDFKRSQNPSHLLTLTSVEILLTCETLQKTINFLFKNLASTLKEFNILSERLLIIKDKIYTNCCCSMGLQNDGEAEAVEKNLSEKIREMYTLLKKISVRTQQQCLTTFFSVFLQHSHLSQMELKKTLLNYKTFLIYLKKKKETISTRVNFIWYARFTTNGKKFIDEKFHLLRTRRACYSIIKTFITQEMKDSKELFVKIEQLYVMKKLSDPAENDHLNYMSLKFSQYPLSNHVENQDAIYLHIKISAQLSLNDSRQSFSQMLIEYLEVREEIFKEFDVKIKK